MVKPKPISETAVRVQAMNVRSMLRRVRSHEKWVWISVVADGAASPLGTSGSITTSPPARSRVEDNEARRDQHDALRQRVAPIALEDAPRPDRGEMVDRCVHRVVPRLHHPPSR